MIFLIKFIKNYWKPIVFILVFPFILDWVLRFIWWIPIPIKESAPLSEWLGFLGAYFGVIGAIAVVWWQLNEEKVRETINKNETELESAITFLITFRETCENYIYFISNVGEFNSSNDYSNNIFKINDSLFNASIKETNIMVRSQCIELFYFFDKYSIQNTYIYNNYSDYFKMLIDCFNTLYDSTNNLLTEYEKIKIQNINYINIINSRIENDLDTLFKEFEIIEEKFTLK